MAVFSKVQSAFLSSYVRDVKSYEDGAAKAKDLVRALLDRTAVPVHVIEARAKDPRSLRRKVFVERYKDPSKEVTDLIGVRVIVFYEEDIQAVVDALHSELSIDEKLSIDKRVILGKREFGYRSTHLIASLKGHRTTAAEHKNLQKRRIEIQIRTVLQHAWAEIEHEVVYKSGVKYPESTDRRFASLAGTLEMLGREFSTLRNEKAELISSELAAMKKQFNPSGRLSTVSLSALFELMRPAGQRFYQSRGIPSGIESLCVEALRRCKIGKVGALQACLRKRWLNEAIRRYAVNLPCAPENVSDFYIVILILVNRNRDLATELFPEFLTDINTAAS